METRQAPQLIAAFNALLASMSQTAERGIGIAVNADAESGFTSAEFQRSSSRTQQTAIRDRSRSQQTAVDRSRSQQIAIDRSRLQ